MSLSDCLLVFERQLRFKPNFTHTVYDLPKRIIFGSITPFFMQNILAIDNEFSCHYPLYAFAYVIWTLQRVTQHANIPISYSNIATFIVLGISTFDNFVNDHPLGNQFWRKQLGCSESRMRLLEVHFMRHLSFNIWIDEKGLQSCLSSMTYIISKPVKRTREDARLFKAIHQTHNSLLCDERPLTPVV